MRPQAGEQRYYLNSDEKSTAGLLSKLDARGSALPFFEALLHVKVSGGVPVQPELVLLRRR